MNGLDTPSTFLLVAFPVYSCSINIRSHFVYSVREPPPQGNVFDNMAGRLGIHHL
jgi:hypothetical protein